MSKEKVFLALILVFIASGLSRSAFAAEPGKAVFLISPLAGSLSSDIQYQSPGGSGTKTLSEVGSLYGLNMVYASPDFNIGSIGHYSKLNYSTVNGYLFYVNYFFRQDEPVQPMLGFSADYIHIFTREDSVAAAPLASLNVDTSIWAFHPIVGLSLKKGELRVTPFVGYFNEQVATSLASEGMNIGGQTSNGFSAASSATLNCISTGAALDFTFARFVKAKTKFYWRFGEGDRARLTARNQLDFFLSKQMGILLKYDYFDDKYEKNIFTSIGAAFVL